MHVAYWVKVFPPRYESFIVNQIAGLAERGHEVTVFARRRGASRNQLTDVQHEQLMPQVIYWPAISGRRIVRGLQAVASGLSCGLRRPSAAARLLLANGASRPIGRTRMIFDAVPFLRNRPWDVLHCQYAELGAMAVRLRQLGVFTSPIIASVRGFDMRRIEADTTGVSQRLLAEADLVLPVSDYFRRRLTDVGCDDSKVMVHRSGVNLDAVDNALRQVRQVSKRPILVLVGRLVEKKGIEVAIRAAALLVERFSDMILRIIGDGPLRERLRQLADDLGLSNRVEIAGWLPHDEVLAQMARATVLVQPSITTSDGTQEGIPNSLKEAMALGIPVVGTSHAGIPELVEDGVSGFLVPERDEVALAQRIEHLLRHPEQCRAMGQAGSRRVRQHYDTRCLGDELVRLYESIRCAVRS